MSARKRFRQGDRVTTADGTLWVVSAVRQQPDGTWRHMLIGVERDAQGYAAHRAAKVEQLTAA